jgi:hypothetical protein
VRLTVSGSLSTATRKAVGAALRGDRSAGARASARCSLGVALCGFRLDSVTHESGYTIHALGIETASPVRDGDVVRFDVDARVQPGPVPIATSDLATYGAEVQVDWVLIASIRVASRRGRVLDARIRDSIVPGPARPAVPRELGERPEPRARSALLSGFDLDHHEGRLGARAATSARSRRESRTERISGDRTRRTSSSASRTTGRRSGACPPRRAPSFTLLELGADAK